MNGTRQESQALLEGLMAGWKAAGLEKNCDMLICPPFTLLGWASRSLNNTGIRVGGQDCHFAEKGAHTGDISAPMLAEIGCEYVILGHSERREHYQEGNELIQQKAQAALNHQLIPIICVGEKLAEREQGQHIQVVLSQLQGSLPEQAKRAAIVIAYEPVWAIGTGKVAEIADIQAMHAAIYQWLDKNGFAAAQTPILYGGSVKPDNAAQIFQVPHVDGALVGGASLKADDFLKIAQAS